MRVQLLNRVKNIVAKGEIAHYEQFLLFTIMFSTLIHLLNSLEILYIFAQMLMESYATDLMYVGKD